MGVENSNSSRFEVLYDRIVKSDGDRPGLLSFDLFMKLILADPTTKYSDIDILTKEYDEIDTHQIKVGKYSNWLLKCFIKPTECDEHYIDEYRRLFIEDLKQISDYLLKFDEIKPLLDKEFRDIYQYSLSELKLYLANLPDKVIQKRIISGVQVINSYEFPGSEIIFVGEKYTLIKIEGVGYLQRKAAEWFGGFYDYLNGETQWCTSIEDSENFIFYASKGPLYVIIPNKSDTMGGKTGLPTERYQLHFPTNQFMDRYDNRIDLVGLLNGEMSELKSSLKSEFINSLLFEDETKLELECSTESVRVFFELYDMSDLFMGIKTPEKIKIILLSYKKTNNSLLYEIPKEITRFINLTTLSLNNTIISLPNEIEHCENLRYLTLVGNRFLNEIPETIKNIHSLEFLVVRNCSPLLIIPKTILQQFTESSPGFYIKN